jgi:hypothetical protein
MRRQLIRSESGGARDCCEQAKQCKQQEREREYRSKSMNAPATLCYRSGGCWCVGMPSTQSLDPWCSPSQLLEHEPLVCFLF